MRVSVETRVNGEKFVLWEEERPVKDVLSRMISEGKRSLALDLLTNFPVSREDAEVLLDALLGEPWNPDFKNPKYCFLSKEDHVCQIRTGNMERREI